MRKLVFILSLNMLSMQNGMSADLLSLFRPPNEEEIRIAVKDIITNAVNNGEVKADLNKLYIKKIEIYSCTGGNKPKKYSSCEFRAQISLNGKNKSLLFKANFELQQSEDGFANGWRAKSYSNVTEDN